MAKMIKKVDSLFDRFEEAMGSWADKIF